MSAAWITCAKVAARRLSAQGLGGDALGTSLLELVADYRRQVRVLDQLRRRVDPAVYRAAVAHADRGSR